jgi:hypothetical protein
MFKRSAILAMGLLLGTVAGAAGQVHWDAPTFFSPRPAEDIGLYFWQPDLARSDWAAGAIWRQHGNLSLGVRGGYADGGDWMLGAEFFGPINLLGPGTGLLTSWVLGFGATFDGVTQLRVPVGLSVGVNIGQPGGIQLLPYVHPRVALDLVAVDVGGREETDTEFNFAVDVGADAALGDAFVLRVGATVAGAGATTFGAGIGYRFTRRLIVR